MLAAIVEDFAAAAGRRIVTTLDHRLADGARERLLRGWATVHVAESPECERILFCKLAAESRSTFVIAPETAGELRERRRTVDAVGGRFLGADERAIDLCADKLAFFEHLERHGVPTIPTVAGTKFTNQFPFPLVVKPYDGAGSQDTFLIRNAAGLAHASSRTIVQPYVEGVNLSVAALVDAASGTLDVFPVGEQILAGDGGFGYLGGCIPARVPVPHGVAPLIERVCRSIPGLDGYIGFDLILESKTGVVRIVEANPRLTTAYIGYRVLCRENLAARLLAPHQCQKPPSWNAGAVEFRASGQVVNFDSGKSVPA